MRIVLEHLSRNFGSQKVLEDLNFEFSPGNSYAIQGGNGSGKSTLLKIIMGALSPSGGKVKYYINGSLAKAEEIPFKITLASPYLELIEELTAIEFLQFYGKFRKFRKGISAHEILKICALESSANKAIGNFSSGMKQRLRLGLALLAEADLILLDEPTSNLDPAGIKWYQSLVKTHLNGRTIIVGSNFNESEIGFCSESLELQPMK